MVGKGKVKSNNFPVYAPVTFLIFLFLNTKQAVPSLFMVIVV